MSIALLQETQTELRRLSIAGGVLAKDDIRLKKLVLQLAEAGKTAPVFARLVALAEKHSTKIPPPTVPKTINSCDKLI